MSEKNLIKLIKNLRRGKNIEKSKKLFFTELQNNYAKWCKELSLRWLISIVDTYIDHGMVIYRNNAAIISTFANIIKISDTAMLLHKRDDTLLSDLKNDVTYLYDGVYSFKITDGDMINNLFYRLDVILSETPELWAIFEEIIHRLAKYSHTLQIAEYHKHFYEKTFFEGRKSFNISKL